MSDNYRKNCEYICQSFFDELSKIEAIYSHNATTHGTLEGIKRYYIVQFTLRGSEERLVIDIEDMINNSSSIEGCYTYMRTKYSSKKFKCLLEQEDFTGGY